MTDVIKQNLLSSNERHIDICMSIILRLVFVYPVYEVSLDKFGNYLIRAWEMTTQLLLIWGGQVHYLGDKSSFD